VIRICRALLYSLLVLHIAPSVVSAQGKELEPFKIGYSGIGITHDLLKMMGSNRIREAWSKCSIGLFRCGSLGEGGEKWHYRQTLRESTAEKVKLRRVSYCSGPLTN